MDKAPAYGAGDSEFEPRFGYTFVCPRFVLPGSTRCSALPAFGSADRPGKQNLLAAVVVARLDFYFLNKPAVMQVNCRHMQIQLDERVHVPPEGFP